MTLREILNLSFLALDLIARRLHQRRHGGHAPTPDSIVGNGPWSHTFLYLANALRIATKPRGMVHRILNPFNLQFNSFQIDRIDEPFSITPPKIDGEVISFETSRLWWEKIIAIKADHAHCFPNEEFPGLRYFCLELSTIEALAQALSSSSKSKLQKDEENTRREGDEALGKGRNSNADERPPLTALLTDREMSDWGGWDRVDGLLSELIDERDRQSGTIYPYHKSTHNTTKRVQLSPKDTPSVSSSPGSAPPAGASRISIANII